MLPTVHQTAEWKDVTSLALESGIGQSTGSDGQPFAQFVTQNTAPFSTDPKTAGSAMQLWQPSDPFSDGSQNVYVFRMTDASPAHPADLADVKARVTADATTKSAYELAVAAATKFADSARRDGYSRAAIDYGKQLVQVGPFNPQMVKSEGDSVPNFIAGPDAVKALAAKTIDLLAEKTDANPNPIGVVLMPGERKAVVIQLSNVNLVAPASEFYFRKMDESQRFDTDVSEGLASDYFKYNTVVARLDFHPEQANKSED